MRGGADLDDFGDARPLGVKLDGLQHALEVFAHYLLFPQVLPILLRCLGGSKRRVIVHTKRLAVSRSAPPKEG